MSNDKPEFDPGKGFEKVDDQSQGQQSKPEFDPNLAFQKMDAPISEVANPIESFVQGVGQGASLGYLPQIQAMAEPAVQKALQLLTGDSTDEVLKSRGFNVQQNDPSYTQRRDQYIKDNEKLTNDNPYSSIAGNVAGTIPIAIGLGALLSGAGIVGEGATAGQKLLNAAKTGAVIGAIRNPGDTEGDISPIQLGDRVKNSAIDAATGGVLEGGLLGVGKVGSILKNAAPDLLEYSQGKALKASGAMLKQFRKAFGEDKVGSLGQAALDEGIVQPGMNISDIANKAEEVRQGIGNNINNIYDQADAALKAPVKTENPLGLNTELASLGQSKSNPTNGFNLKAMAESIRSDLADKYKGKAGSSSILNKMYTVLDEISENQTPDFSKMKEVRQSIDEMIDHSKANQELGPIQQELKNLRNKIQEQVKGGLEVLDQRDGTNLAEQFSKENARYNKVSTLSDMAMDKTAREESNAAFGLRERMSGGAGAVIGGAIGGVPGAIAGGALGSITTKVARNYGTPYIATVANKVARALEANPKALGAFSEGLLRVGNTPQQFVTAVNQLMSKPEFKKQIEKINEPQQQIENYKLNLGNKNNENGRQPTSN